MQHDDLIWQVIRHNHCSYMAKINTANFCRNPYNVTGLCNRSSCPLANSRYATIREHEGVFYLYMKTIERAHKPNQLWERVKLHRNYEKALETIDKHLEYWPKLLVHKVKQRLTKMTQYRIRMRKLQLKVREKIMTVPTKLKKREARREEKAEKAALLEKSIEKELLERLKNGVYEEIYNFPFTAYENVLAKEGLQPAEEEEEAEVEYVEGFDELEEEDDIEDFGGFFNDGSFKDEDYDDIDEDEPMNMVDRPAAKKSKKEEGSQSGKAGVFPVTQRRRKGRVLVEVEGEEDMADRQRLQM